MNANNVILMTGTRRVPGRAKMVKILLFKLVSGNS